MAAQFDINVTLDLHLTSITIRLLSFRIGQEEPTITHFWHIYIVLPIYFNIHVFHKDNIEDIV
jgi:hypothetical protein